MKKKQLDLSQLSQKEQDIVKYIANINGPDIKKAERFLEILINVANEKFDSIVPRKYLEAIDTAMSGKLYFSKLGINKNEETDYAYIVLAFIKIMDQKRLNFVELYNCLKYLYAFTGSAGRTASCLRKPYNYGDLITLRCKVAQMLLKNFPCEKALYECLTYRDRDNKEVMTFIDCFDIILFRPHKLQGAVRERNRKMRKALKEVIEA